MTASAGRGGRASPAQVARPRLPLRIESLRAVFRSRDDRLQRAEAEPLEIARRHSRKYLVKASRDDLLNGSRVLREAFRRSRLQTRNRRSLPLLHFLEGRLLLKVSLLLHVAAI